MKEYLNVCLHVGMSMTIQCAHMGTHRQLEFKWNSMSTDVRERERTCVCGYSRPLGMNPGISMISMCAPASLAKGWASLA